MAQIIALGLFYPNQVAKSVEKCGIVQKNRFEGPTPPPKFDFFWKIFMNFLRINHFGPQGLALMILCNYRPILVNLETN